MTEQPPSWSVPGSPPGDSPTPSAGPFPTPAPTPAPAYPGGSGAYAEYRPGIVAIRPLALNDIFTGMISAIRGNPAATMGLGLVTTLAFVAPATLLASALARYFTPRIVNAMGVGDLPEIGQLIGTFAGLIPTYAGAFAVLIMTAFTAFVIGQGVIGHKVSLAQTWAATKGRLVRVIGAAILVFLITLAATLITLGIPVALMILSVSGDTQNGAAVVLAFGVVFLGALATIAVSLFLSTRWAFAASIITLEDLGVIAAMRRSWRLSSGRPFWRILGIRVLILVIASVGGFILGLPITQGGSILVAALGLSTGATVTALVIVSALAAVLTGTLTTPFTAGGDTLLYIDQRIRREGLDVALIRAAGGGG